VTGRAQELMLLIEMYWERMKLDVPVYVTGGLSTRATQYVRAIFIFSWSKFDCAFLAT
jgi:Cft2 family RNA processing exonuclease